MKFVHNAISSLYLLLFFLTPLIILPWSSELFEFNKLTFTYIITILISFFYLTKCLIEKKFIFKKTPLDIPLVIFLFVNLVSLLFSIDPATSWLGYYGRWNGGLLSLISYSILYWIYVSTQDESSTKSHLKVLITSALMVSIYGILQHFGIDAHLWVQDVQIRVFSSIGQPNWLAAFLVALIFIPISLVQKDSKSKLIYSSITIIFFLCLLYTKSRSGLLSLGLSGLVFSFYLTRTNKLKDYLEDNPLGLELPALLFSFFLSTIKQIKNFLKIHIWIFIISALLVIIVPNPIKSYITKSSTPPTTGPALEQGGTESGLIRQIVWTGAINAWKSTPKNFLIGSGPETFAMIYYQYRPLEHNKTSEWELLYNKAHNEFLNYLTTIGIIGLISYLVVLFFQLKILDHNLKSSTESLLQISLLAGWFSILVTNFWGFSVVIVQLLLFLLPALAFTLNSPKTETTVSKVSINQKLFVIIITLPLAYLLFTTLKYWRADYYYASAQKFESQFQSTDDTNSLIRAFNDISTAHTLNPQEPFINTTLAGISGYLSVLTAEIDATSSAELSTLATQAANQALTLSPSHPAHYKSVSRTFILLSAYDPEYLRLASQTLSYAEKISPTDPRIPYNKAIIAKYQNDNPKALEYFQKAIDLKPNFLEAIKQYETLATQSATPTN